MQPAIDLAENGFIVSETLAKVLAASAKEMGKWPATTAIFWRNGAPLKAGDRLIQKDLAQSLRLIADQGSYAFYQGEIAKKLQQKCNLILARSALLIWRPIKPWSVSLSMAVIADMISSPCLLPHRGRPLSPDSEYT